MAKLKITIEPLSLIALFLLVYFGWIEQVMFYLVALCLHEFSHYYVAKKLGYSLNDLRFTPFGVALSGSKNFFKLKDEILIALAGPLTNLALAFLSIAFWWIIPNSYNITYFFVMANLSLFIFNMLPLFPLDAGRIILAVIQKNKKARRVYKLFKVNSILISTILIICFFISLLNIPNLTLLFIPILLIDSIYNVDKSLYYKYSYLDKKEEDYCKVLPVKEYYVPVDIKSEKLLKLIDKNTYSIFIFVDKSGKIIKIINEKDLIKSKQGQTI